MKVVTQMYNLHVGEKISDFTWCLYDGNYINRRCLYNDKFLCEQFRIIKDYLNYERKQQNLEKARNEKGKEDEDVCVLDVNEDVLGVHVDIHESETNETPNAFVEGESSVSTNSCDSKLLHSESSVSNDESQSKSRETMKVKVFLLYWNSDG